MRRLILMVIFILVALSMTFPHAGAMSNTDKDSVAMAAERALMGENAITSTSYSVSIAGPNNDINVTVMSTNLNKANLIVDLDPSQTANIVAMYVLFVDKYPDLGNLNVIYENDNGIVDIAYGFRSWAEQVRKDDNGYGTDGYRYNRDDLTNFASKMLYTLV